MNEPAVCWHRDIGSIDVDGGDDHDDNKPDA